LYEIDDNPKRKEFLDELFSFMQKRGQYMLEILCRDSHHHLSFPWFQLRPKQTGPRFVVKLHSVKLEVFQIFGSLICNTEENLKVVWDEFLTIS
jgi:hypothetical protein